MPVVPVLPGVRGVGGHPAGGDRCAVFELPAGWGDDVKPAIPIAAAVLAAAAPILLAGEAEPPPSRGDVTAGMLRAQLARERHAHGVVVARLHAALRAARSRPDYVWWSTRDPHRVADAVFDEQGVTASERTYWRCIINRESGWKSDVWYGGARGWQPRYAGTDRVNGLMQLRPYHADLRDDRVVSYATFLRTSDPVFSLRKAIRLGHNPFFASNGGCRG